MVSTVKAVDLFCGAGGLTNGLEKAGIGVTAGYDIAPECAYPYQENNSAEFRLKSVAEIEGDEIRALYAGGKYSLLAGCAPCQPFSTYMQGKKRKDDEKWGLLYEFARLIEQSSPDLVTMENVPNLMRHEVYRDFMTRLEALGYHVSSSVVKCEEYGLPQSRQRLVLLASKLGEITLIEPTHKGSPVTVRDAINRLRPLSAGDADKNDPLHYSARLSELNVERVRASKPGGTWRDWPKHLVAECHRKQSGGTYPSVYGRMVWDAPAPTMTTQCFGFGNGRFGHPKQDRAISLREAAIFQSFPVDYKFTPPGEQIYFKQVGRLIGNAVPVRLGEVIGLSIKEHLKRHGKESH